MMLMDMPEVASVLADLRLELEMADPAVLYPEYLKRFNSVTEWKFSTGDFFSPIPYESERMGFSPDRFVKKTYRDVDEARELGKYCSGFVGNRHVLTVCPGKPSTKALLVSFYDEGANDLKIRSVNFKRIGEPKAQSILGSIGRIISMSDNTKLRAVVGAWGAFSVSLYKFGDERRPLYVREFSSGWEREAEWQYHYSVDGQLEKITADGATPVWTRKQ